MIKDVRMVKVHIARAIVVKDVGPVVVWSCKGPPSKAVYLALYPVGVLPGEVVGVDCIIPVQVPGQ